MFWIEARKWYFVLDTDIGPVNYEGEIRRDLSLVDQSFCDHIIEISDSKFQSWKNFKLKSSRVNKIGECIKGLGLTSLLACAEPNIVALSSTHKRRLTQILTNELSST